MNADSIGDLILQELRLIREEMKDEIRRLCNSIQSLHNEKPNQTFLNTKQDIPSHPANLLRFESNLDDQNHQANAHHLPKSTNVLLECNNIFSNEHCERTNLKKFKVDHSKSQKCKFGFPKEKKLYVEDTIEQERFLKREIPDEDCESSTLRKHKLDHLESQEFEFEIQNEKKLFVEDMIEQNRLLKRETPVEEVAPTYPVVVEVKSMRDSTQRLNEFRSNNSTKLQRNKYANKGTWIYVNKRNDFADACTGKIEKSGKKLYRCVICNKNVSTKSNLNKHYRIHSGEKTHKCTICCKSFFAKSDLITHIRVHTGEKPFKCNLCHKTFSVKSNLTKHTRNYCRGYSQGFT